MRGAGDRPRTKSRAARRSAIGRPSICHWGGKSYGRMTLVESDVSPVNSTRTEFSGGTGGRRATWPEVLQRPAPPDSSSNSRETTHTLFPASGPHVASTLRHPRQRGIIVPLWSDRQGHTGDRQQAGHGACDNGHTSERSPCGTCRASAPGKCCCPGRSPAGKAAIGRPRSPVDSPAAEPEDGPVHVLRHAGRYDGLDLRPSPGDQGAPRGRRPK